MSMQSYVDLMSLIIISHAESVASVLQLFTRNFRNSNQKAVKLYYLSMTNALLFLENILYFTTTKIR